MMHAILNSRLGLLSLLLAFFFLNYAETQMEASLKSPSQYETGYAIAQAFQELEGHLDFSRHEDLGSLAITAHSVSYFILFPVLLLAVGGFMMFRSEISPFRVLTLGLSLCYLISLSFFLFFPVPERWAFPEANAVLLADAWSPKWVDLHRAVRGLDNSFPSLPAAFLVVAIFVGYRFRFKFKNTVCFLGLAVIVSSFTLGIHWLPDLALGSTVGIFSASLAVLWDQRIVDRIERVKPELAKGGIKVLRSKASGRKSTFISYRRETGSIMARIVQSELKKRGHFSFLDVDDLGPKQFGERLLREIESVPNFVLVLSPGSLDRCVDQEDWLRREISHAIQTKRHIVPLMVDEFQYPPKEKIPDDLEELLHHNGVTYSHEYFAATFDKLADFLQKA
ncbi:MAG: TIR domain-containing protein [Nitrospinaceae bacterium]|nr:TIR domain-containing protein [Nitrospinaceae bacterium]NIR55517.1 TIR domain-containing protein [Nitrospinaceae bacterium]NIS85948.1 TIR domain-containing protein [Nitrospinaceae bacterium]NIT82797.1 TIR domain-containing protein [Nitrospinaceae bacterium]NIU44999.1 TIR domain-containing protein [Nitrospinaceae bacterium]